VIIRNVSGQCTINIRCDNAAYERIKIRLKLNGYPILRKIVLRFYSARFGYDVFHSCTSTDRNRFYRVLLYFSDTNRCVFFSFFHRDEVFNIGIINKLYELIHGIDLRQ